MGNNSCCYRKSISAQSSQNQGKSSSHLSNNSLEQQSISSSSSLENSAEREFYAQKYFPHYIHSPKRLSEIFKRHSSPHHIDTQKCSPKKLSYTLGDENCRCSYMGLINYHEQQLQEEEIENKQKQKNENQSQFDDQQISCYCPSHHCLQQQSEFSQQQNLQNYQVQQQQILKITPQERLLIAVSYLIQGQCQGLKPLSRNIELLRSMIETNLQYCFFNPQTLSTKFNLIEMQSPMPFMGVADSEEDEDSESYSDIINSISEGQEDNQEDSQINNSTHRKKRRKQNNNTLSNAFWQQFQYFLDDEILDENDEFQLVVIMHLNNAIKYPFAVQKKFSPVFESFVYTFHDLDVKQSKQQQQQQEKQQINQQSQCMEEALSQINQKQQQVIQDYEIIQQQKEYNQECEEEKEESKQLNQIKKQEDQNRNYCELDQQQLQEYIYCRNYECREIEFYSEEKFSAYLDLFGNFFQAESQQEIKFGVQLVCFKHIEDKSSSDLSQDSENILKQQLSSSDDDEEIVNINNQQSSHSSVKAVYEEKYVQEEEENFLESTGDNNNNRPTLSTNNPY